MSNIHNPIELVTWFSNRIQAERKRLKYSVSDIAKLCCVSATKWRRFEKGEEAPDAKTLFLFAQLGADMQYLFTAEKFSGQELDLIMNFRYADYFGKQAIAYVAETAKKLDYSNNDLSQMGFHLTVKFLE